MVVYYFSQSKCRSGSQLASSNSYLLTDEGLLEQTALVYASDLKSLNVFVRILLHQLFVAEL